MTCIDPLDYAKELVNTTYTVRVGCFTHKVHKATGRHEVVSKDKKQPQAYYYDELGQCHFIDLARDLKRSPSK